MAPILLLMLLGATACQQRPTPSPTRAALEATDTPAPSASLAPATQTETPTVTVVAQTRRPSTTPTFTATPKATSGTPTPTTTYSAAAFDPWAYLPILVGPGPYSTPTQTPVPSVTPTPSPTPYPTVDFAAVRADLQAGGQDLAYAKIGFHLSVGGNRMGLGEWMRRLDEAGVPFFLKSVGDAGPLYEAQQIAAASGVPHTLVFRSHGDVPDYNLTPAEAARRHWEYHRDLFPPELDPQVVWLETVNEVDRNRSEWLAQFSLATAQLALDEGYRWAAFGWAGGEPVQSDWESPSMLQFLRLAAQHPDRIAIAMHEYSALTDDIAFEYPFRVGHFLHLFQVCDRNGIPRPTVLISEWGWAYDHVPSVDDAMRHIAWASALYAPFQEIKGAALWHLGGGETFGDIADEAQRLIAPLTRYSLTNYFIILPLGSVAPADPELFRP